MKARQAARFKQLVNAHVGHTGFGLVRTLLRLLVAEIPPRLQNAGKAEAEAFAQVQIHEKRQRRSFARPSGAKDSTQASQCAVVSVARC